MTKLFLELPLNAEKKLVIDETLLLMRKDILFLLTVFVIIPLIIGRVDIAFNFFLFLCGCLLFSLFVN